MYFSESDNFTVLSRGPVGKTSGQLLSSITAKKPKLLIITAYPSLLSFYMGQHFTSNMEPLVIAFEVRECNL